MENDYNVEVRGKHLRETEKAHLVDVDGLGEVWFPKSQIGEIDGKPKGPVVFFCTEWIARNKGIIE